jgi:hypothetical protein
LPGALEITDADHSTIAGDILGQTLNLVQFLTRLRQKLDSGAVGDRVFDLDRVPKASAVLA